MQLRIRGPTGVATISLPATTTVQDLHTEISSKTGLSDYDLKIGYPPEPLDLSGVPPDLPLEDTGIIFDRQQLLASRKEGDRSQDSPKVSQPQHLPKLEPPAATVASSSRPKPPSTLNDPPEVHLPARAATLVLRVMPDDNSCMFRALSSAVLTDSLDGMTELRSLVASTIQSDPITYSAAILDKPPDRYCRWIQGENAWGGGIELGILSQYFGIEICSVNVQDGRVDQFNEGAARRCILIYSGIHYDVVALVSAVLPMEGDTKMFEADDDGVLVAAVQLCERLRERHYYTDTGALTVKCKCGWEGKGEKEAVEHAQKTGHYDFGEV